MDNRPEPIDEMPSPDGGVYRILPPKAEGVHSEPYSMPTPEAVRDTPLTVPDPGAVRAEPYYEMPGPGGTVYRIYRR